MKLPSPGKKPDPEDPKGKADSKPALLGASSAGGSGLPPQSAKAPAPKSLRDFLPATSRLHKSPAHEIADLAEAYGGVNSKPLNTEGEILTRVSLLDENNERIGVSIPMRFSTRKEMEDICTALNIPKNAWPKSHN